MFCKKCGNEINGNVRFCQKCGTPVSGDSGGVNIAYNGDVNHQVRGTDSSYGSNMAKNSNNSKNGIVIALVVTLVVLILAVVLAVVAIKSGMLSEFGGKGAVEQESESKSDRDDESSESSSDEERNEMSEENNKTGQESTEAVEESNSENTDNTNNADRFSKVETQNEEVVVDDGSVETAEPEDFAYILFDSDSRYVNENELLGFTKGMCRLARNEIYARHGRKFKDEELQNYFLSRSWYVPTIEPDDFKESMLNDYEIKNLEVISKYENEKALPDPERALSYQEAYRNVLEQYVLQEYCENSRFSLGYVDEDNIPELFVVVGDHHAAGVDVYTYYNNQAVRVGCYGAYGALSYAAKKNYIQSINGGMGAYYESYYSIKNSREKCLYNFSTYEETVNDEIVWDYYVNDVKVSKTEYDIEYAKAKNVVDAIDTEVEYVSLYEINDTNLSRILAN